ncbi:MAG TPA: hypothetical protein VHW70_15315 [Edaphobacter sp.]|jgi:hypothetical protein|nr:hypothetical protein [Edaphobacter sp.]
MRNDSITNRKPAVVTVVAVFLFFASVVAWITGTSLLFPRPFWQKMWDLNRPAYIAFSSFGKVSGILLVALGAGTGAAGIGLLKGKEWCWWFAVVLFAINGIGDLVTLFLTHDLIRGGSGVLIAIIFLFCLTRLQVKRYCGVIPALNGQSR